MCASDRLRACLGHAEILSLPVPNQVLHRPGHVLDRNLRVYAMLIEEVDAIDTKTLQHPVDHALHLLIRERPVRFSRVEKCDTAFDRRPDERYQLPLVFWQKTASVAIPHAPETEG